MAASVAPPQFDQTTSDAARAGAKAYLQSRLAPPSSTPAQPFTIPTIDLGPSFSGSAAARAEVARQIHEACTTSGFFTITNHGIPADVTRGVLRQAQRFFHELPPARKQALHMRHSALHRGYEPAAYTSIDGSAETKEGFNWGYEERLRPASFADTYDGGYVELDGQRYDDGTGNLWPSEEDLPGFFDGVKEYYGEAMGLARHLMGLFGLALGLGEGWFDKSMTHPGGIARLLYYPPGKPEQEQSKQDIGLGAHSDYECFTILLPSGTPGLEVLSPAGQWTPVERVDGGLIVNIADFLMRWTNDLYKSTVHRVVNRTGEARYSVPLFFSINYDEVVETLPSCVTPSNLAKYPPIRAGEYVLERLNMSTAGGKGSYGNTDWLDEKK
ncbi:hypothetical protein IWZ03DRAFT_388257 [Phyllosticta citriasiana]|uniref:Fe2OG dioxygenase domain-containing protein n=1 Tax=Phyllosticta citriasiana TaxID=595635 RepID=A0ABR1K929_9PEZI